MYVCIKYFCLYIHTYIQYSHKTSCSKKLQAFTVLYVLKLCKFVNSSNIHSQHILPLQTTTASNTSMSASKFIAQACAIEKYHCALSSGLVQVYTPRTIVQTRTKTCTQRTQITARVDKFACDMSRCARMLSVPRRKFYIVGCALRCRCFDSCVIT